jgi:hypothetical protein
MPNRTSGYVLAVICVFTATASFADKPAPTVKVQIEVTVYEDGDVQVRRASNKTKKPKTKMAKKNDRSKDLMPCCSERSCDMCSKKSDKPQARKPNAAKQSSAISVISKSLMALDKNEDGRLNADEVAPRLKSPFSQVDLNGDGYLDAGEIRRQIKKKMKAS